MTLFASPRLASPRRFACGGLDRDGTVTVATGRGSRCRVQNGTETRYAMGLYDTFGKASKPDSNPGVRPIELYMCSVVKRMGYADGELS